MMTLVLSSKQRSKRQVFQRTRSTWRGRVNPILILSQRLRVNWNLARHPCSNWFLGRSAGSGILYGTYEREVNTRWRRKRTPATTCLNSHTTTDGSWRAPTRGRCEFSRNILTLRHTFARLERWTPWCSSVRREFIHARWLFGGCGSSRRAAKKALLHQRLS